MSVVNQILAHSELRPEHPAIYSKNTCISYQRLANDIKRVATKLQMQMGEKGPVMINASNNYAFIVVYFAVHYIGASVVNVSTDIDEKTKQFISSKSKPVLCIESCEDFTGDIEDYAPAHASKCGDDTYADLMFTSGTTGEPKGVGLTHEQLTLATEHIISHVGNGLDDVELLLMPLSHSFGMGRMRTTLYAGGTLVIGYPLQRLKGVFKAIEEHHVTGLGLVPSAWSFITQMSKSLISKFSHQLKYIEFGSAYLSPEDKKQLTEWFPDTRLVMHYGLTEVSRATFIYLHDDKQQAVGRLSRGAEFAIFLEDGSRADDGEEGEIAFRAPWMLSEYYQNTALTSDSFVDGYFKTGDLGVCKDDYLYLTGRLKEIINVGGKKVSPTQVEEVLDQNEYILESACIAMRELTMGEVVQAFIVVAPLENISFEDVVDKLKRHTANALPVHMRPQKYTQIDALPKTSTGKLQRLQLASL